MIKVAPSILSADFASLKDEIIKIDESGADFIHVDVMDGSFVPNITIGMPVVKSIRPYTNLPFDVHLMISNPSRYIKDFAESGADYITFHYEALCSNNITDVNKGSSFSAVAFVDLVETIHCFGKKAGVSIKPNTDIREILPFLEKVDLVLVMSVEPGFGGQSFMVSSLAKIEALAKHRQAYDLGYVIEVDGGIDNTNISLLKDAGADIVVSGSYLFKQDDMKKAIESLKV